MNAKVLAASIIVAFIIPTIAGGAASKDAQVKRLEDITAVSIPASGLNKVSWSPVERADGYFVYRSSRRDGVFERLNKSITKATTFDDKGLPGGAASWYRVGWVVKGVETMSLPAQARPYSLLTFGGTASVAFTALAQCSDGGYALLGRGPAPTPGVKGPLCLARVDAAGAITWQKDFPSWYDREITSIVQGADSGFLLAGSALGTNAKDIWIGKVSATGASLWEKRFAARSRDEATPLGIVPARDGSFLLFGGGLSSAIAKLDGKGTIIWVKEYALGKRTDVCDVIQSADGGYALCGAVTSFLSDSSDALIMKLDGSGSVSWRRDIGGEFPDGALSIAELPDGGFAIGGWTDSYLNPKLRLRHALICRFQSTGELVWQKVVGVPYGSQLCSSLITDARGDLFFTGLNAPFSAGSKELRLTRLSPSGDVEWHRAYDHSLRFVPPNPQLVFLFNLLAPDGEGLVIGARRLASNDDQVTEILTLPKAGALPGASFIADADFDAADPHFCIQESGAFGVEWEYQHGRWTLKDPSTPLVFPGPSAAVCTFAFGNNPNELGFVSAARMEPSLQVDGMFFDESGSLVIHDAANGRIIQLDTAFEPSVSGLPLADVPFGQIVSMNGRIVRGAQDEEGSFLMLDSSSGKVLLDVEASVYPFPADHSLVKYYSSADNLLIGELDIVPAVPSSLLAPPQHWMFSLESRPQSGGRAIYRNHEETLAYVRGHARDKSHLWVSSEGALMRGDSIFTGSADFLLRTLQSRNPHLSGPAYDKGGSRIIGVDRDGNYYLQQSDIIRVLARSGDVVATVLLRNDSCAAAMDSNGSVFELDLSPALGQYTLLRHERTWGYRAIPAQIVDDAVNFRRFPSTVSLSLAKLSRGTSITVLSRTEDRMTIGSQTDYWYRVSVSDGTCGWVFAPFVALTGAAKWEALP